MKKLLVVLLLSFVVLLTGALMIPQTLEVVYKLDKQVLILFRRSVSRTRSNQ